MRRRGRRLLGLAPAALFACASPAPDPLIRECTREVTLVPLIASDCGSATLFKRYADGVRLLHPFVSRKGVNRWPGGR